MSSARLHDSLSYLRGPKSFPNDIPLDNLSAYLSDLFSHANLITNSVPPPTHWSSLPNSSSAPNPRSSSTPSQATDESQKHFWPSWGKPLKISKKDNPLNIPVHKMAGSDRHGAWFARRSVHRGLRFAQWKRCMEQEFVVSMEVEGAPGAGAVRGIAADQRVEERVVDGVGMLQVWQLSATFPGPVAPREFVAMTASTDRCGDCDGGEEQDGVRSNHYMQDGVRSNHYMVVSIPVDHPDAAPRDGLVRGFYESVEVIRQVELAGNKQSKSSTSSLAAGKPERSRSTSRQRAGTMSDAESPKGEKVDTVQEGMEAEGADDDDGTAVEWIMITRSDPGGGIPRFIVERNIPASITHDAAKFLTWATQQEELIEEEAEMEKQGLPVEERERRLSCRRESLEEARPSPAEANGHLAGVMPPSSGHGIMASLAAATENALEAYTPNAIREGLEQWLPHPRPTHDAEGDEDISTETSSLSSFESAQQFYTIEDHDTRDSSSWNVPTDSMKSSQSSEERTEQEAMLEDSKHYKELEKLEKRRKELEARFEKQRQMDAKKSEDISSKEARDAEKARERHDKEVRKQKEKHDKEIKKLEEKREREAKRLIERQRKAQEKDGLAKTKRDRDEFKSQVDILKKENELLREQVLGLQAENTMLVREVGKLDGGPITLRTVKDEIKKGSRDRGSSVGSKESGRSKASKESYPSKGSGDGTRSDATEMAAAEE